MLKMNRKTRKCGTDTNPMGLGCWAIGGPFIRLNRPEGCGIDDGESTRTTHRAKDSGVNFFLIG